jgi:hypothetical protein
MGWTRPLFVRKEITMSSGICPIISGVDVAALIALLWANGPSADMVGA